MSRKKDPVNKIVIRFFKSKVSDFKTEAALFRLMGSKGLGPKEIEITPVYRVEECIDGKPLTMIELRNPWIAQATAQILCKTNYDKELNDKIV